MPTAIDATQTALAVAGVAAAMLLMALGLGAARPAPLPFALLLLGAIYALPAPDHVLPVPVYGSGLLVTGELAYWSLDERIREHMHPGVATPRLLAVLAVGAAAIPASALVLAVADADVARSPAGTAAGAAAIVGCVALLIALAHLRGGEDIRQRSMSEDS